MLSLAPGSACDVCLEPFGAELKAPCSIPCGHVFCVNCLHQVARPSCPLCRTPFDTRQTIKLHIDLDSISPSSLELTPPSNADDEARQLQNRITQLAATGGSERDTNELTADCKKFLLTVPKEMYSDLRTSYKMLFYMCNIKRNFLAQGSEVKDLQRNHTSLTQEVDRLKAALEVLKIEKRRSEEAWQTVSGERDDFSAECERLHEHLDNAQSQILLLTEQNETAQNQLILLNEELQRLRSETEFSSPEGESPVDFCESPKRLPPSISVVESDSDTFDSSAPFLTPWEGTLTDTDLPEDSPANYPKPTKGGYCGAAGCPHSCDCVPFLLFSPGSREAAAAGYGRVGAPDASPSDVFSSAPTGLSLSLHQNRARSRSRSHSRPRSRSMSRASSPSTRVPIPLSGSPMASMSASMTIPNPCELRGQLQDILRDPPISSSLPNMSSSHFPSSSLSREFRNGAGSSIQAASSRDRSTHPPPAQPRDSYLHPPMAHRSGNPSPLHTSTPLPDPAPLNRPLLYRSTSNVSQASEESRRSAKERRRADRAAAARSSPLIVPEARSTPMLRPQSHNIPITPPSNAHTFSAVHPPMMRPQSHNTPITPSSSAQAVHPPMLRPKSHTTPVTPSSSAQAASTVHPPMMRPKSYNTSPSSSAQQEPLAVPPPTMRPQLLHTSSSQRVPSGSPLGSDAMPRAQTHNTPPPSPPLPNAHQPSSQRMPRAQAHAAPSPTTGSGSRSHSKPPPLPLYSQPQAPVAYAAPPPSPVKQDTPTYDASPSHHAPADAYASNTVEAERVRRSDATDARGGYSGAMRGMSKRMLPHAMAPTTNANMLYAQ